MDTVRVIASRFELIDFIAQGGMGSVYRGHDLETGSAIAIKLLRPEVVLREPEMLERFRREGEALQKLNHPNIVRMIAALQEGDDHYIVMEYMPGSLRALLKAQGRLSIARTLSIGIELADALTRAHHLKIIHRDIKPDNVLLAPDGTPRLTDFGIARAADQMQITTGQFVGTPVYVAPEVVQGKPSDERADSWSFGVLLWEMLTGTPPFLGEQLISTLNAILQSPLPDIRESVPEIPESLASLLTHLLQKNPDHRPASIRRIGAELETIIRSLDGTPLQPDNLSQTLLLDGSRFNTPTPITNVAAPPHNLPTHTTPFIGRTEDVSELLRLVDDRDCRLITLVGAGGMGKTRLSIQVAQQRIAAFVDGVFFAALAPISQPQHIVNAINEALGFNPAGNGTPQEQLIGYLAPRQLLLILDNFEHVLEGAEFVGEILDHAPNVKIIATSREALNLQGEWLHTMRGLEVPPTADAPHLEGYSAIALFLQAARRVKRDFALEANRVPVVRIARLVDGMPLGLELAAAWLKTTTAARIADEIARNFDFLATTARNVTERHRSLRAVFDYSWKLLTPDEARILAALAVFKGGFTESAAKAICGATLNQLSSLIDKSLLRIDSSERYTLHEMVRQYAAEKLHESGQEQAVRDAHADHYSRFVASYQRAIETDGMVRALDAISTEMDNIRQAWTHAVERGQFAVTDHMLEALYYTYRIRSFGQDAWDNFGMAMAALEQLPESPQRDIWYARLLARRSWFTFIVLKYGQKPVPNFKQAADLLRKHNARRDLTFALSYYGVFTHERAESIAALQEALTICREIGYLEGEVLALIFLSRRTVGDESRQYNKQALAIARRVRNVEATSDCLRDLGISEMRLGHYDQVISVITEALVGDRTLNDQLGIATDLNTLGFTYAQLGRYAEAERALREALSICRAIQYNTGEALALRGLGFTALLAGAFETARTCYLETLSIPLLPDYDQQFVRVGLAHIELERGDYATARQMIEKAIAAHPDSDYRRALADGHEIAGFICYRQGAYADADAHFRQALALHYADDQVTACYHILTGLALTRHAQGETGRAAEIAGFVTAQDGIGYVQTQRYLSELCENLESALTPAELGEYEARGRAHTLREMVAPLTEQPA
jgi:serine/threonine protein kinase/tetratricopeptide (TPR) repeat protein